MTIVPFRPDHLERMNLQPAQSFCHELLTPDMVERVAALEGFTAFVDEMPVAVAGVKECGPNLYTAWSLVSADAGRHMVRITRAIARFLDLKAYPAIEAYVDADFDAGKRWMKTLGFRPVGEPVDMAGRLQLRYLRTVPHG